MGHLDKLEYPSYIRMAWMVTNLVEVYCLWFFTHENYFSCFLYNFKLI